MVTPDADVRAPQWQATRRRVLSSADVDGLAILLFFTWAFVGLLATSRSKVAGLGSLVSRGSHLAPLGK